jgi:hypothetical protein
MAFHVASPVLPSIQSRGHRQEASETQTFDPRSFMLNSDDLVARRCVPGQLSPLTGLMLTLWVICGVVFLSWCLSSQSQMEQSVEPATKFPEKSVASTEAVQELPPVEIGKSAIFPLAGLRTLLISLVIMGHQGYMPNSKLMWRYMHGSMTFFIAASGFLKFKSANGVSDWVKFRRYTANTLLRFWPTYFVALLLTLLLMAQVQGSVSIGFPLDAMFIQAFLLLDVCDMVGGNNFLPFQALLVGWFVSVIMWCTLFAPVVSLLRPRSGLPLWVSFVLFVVLLVSHGMMDAYLSWKIYVFAPARFLQFAAGMVCADFAGQLPSKVQRWGGWGWIFDAALLLGFCLCHDAFQPSHNPAKVLLWALEDALWCVVITAAALAAEQRSESRCPQGLLISVFSLYPLAFLAPYSYGAFLFQGIPYHVIQKTFGNLSGWSTLVPVVLPWFMSALSDRYVDVPVRRALEGGPRKK